MNLCNSLFLHSLEFEDVHSLCVAGGREEHAVHAEGQRADAHTPLNSSPELKEFLSLWNGKYPNHGPL